MVVMTVFTERIGLRVVPNRAGIEPFRAVGFARFPTLIFPLRRPAVAKVSVPVFALVLRTLDTKYTTRRASTPLRVALNSVALLPTLLLLSLTAKTCVRDYPQELLRG